MQLRRCGLAGALCWVLCSATGAAQAQRSGQLQPLPLTELDDRALAADLDKHAVTLRYAQAVPIQDLLLALVGGTALSVVTDQDISGSFVGELKSVSVRQALRAVLPPLGLDYSVDGSLVHVFRRQPETRLFDVNYVATSRTGTTEIAGGAAGSLVRVTGETSADLFADLAKGIQGLLSEHGTFNVDRKAGIVQATDTPDRLDRIQNYIDAVHDRVHRQVAIDVRVLEVELNDPSARSIDFDALLSAGQGPNGARGPRLLLSGLAAGDVSKFMTALGTVGKVTLLADPHLLALNNETAIVRGSQGEEDISIAVTPQIAGEGVIMLSLSPIVNLKVTEGDAKTPPVTAVREEDTLARVVSGETLIVSGFGRDHETRERTTGLGGGWLGRSTKVTTRRVALLVLLTPRIVNPVGAQ